MISVQHCGHKAMVHRNDNGVVVCLYVDNHYIGSTLVEDAPFHVVLDRAHDFVRQQNWRTPADLVYL